MLCEAFCEVPVGQFPIFSDSWAGKTAVGASMIVMHSENNNLQMYLSLAYLNVFTFHIIIKEKMPQSSILIPGN
jgi:hypothetical protein